MARPYCQNSLWALIILTDVLTKPIITRAFVVHHSIISVSSKLCSTHTVLYQQRSEGTAHHAGQKKKRVKRSDSHTTDEDENEPLNDSIPPNTIQTERSYPVSDEDVILACRAYLQRKNKLPQGWQQYQRRKRLRQQSLAFPVDQNNKTHSKDVYIQNDKAGYFWEDPNELIYLHKGKPWLPLLQGNYDTVESKQDNIIQMEEEDTSYKSYDQIFFSKSKDKNKSLSPRGFIGPGSRKGGFNTINTKYDNDQEENHGDDNDYIDDNNSDDENMDNINETDKNDYDTDAEIFTSRPSYPTREHTGRSKLMKQLFSDPLWKAKWYAKRWPHLSTEDHRQYGTTIDLDSNPQPRQGQKPMETTSSTSRTRTTKGQSQKGKLLLQKIPSEFFHSEELSSLSKEEIMNAITTYMSSKQKRSLSRKRRILNHEEILHNRTLSQLPENHRTTSHIPSMTSDHEENKIQNQEDAQKILLIERRRIRSEKAKRAYETRRKNLQSLTKDNDNLVNQEIQKTTKKMMMMTNNKGKKMNKKQ